MAHHRNTEQMFPGFYHGWRVPCTPKPSSHATLTLNSFRVRSYDFSPRLKPGVSWVRTKQETPNALPTPLAPPFLPIAKARGISEDLDDFDPGPGVDVFQRITIPAGSGFTISFQWDSPFASVCPGCPGSPT